MRDQTVCMMRIRNEARWIGRNLERTWQVCSKVVLWDDGSTDKTEEVVIASCPSGGRYEEFSGGWILKGVASWGPTELHFLRSPYAAVVRPKMRRNELRDKNCLWWYVKGAVDFKYVLCLDGDEMLSQTALRSIPEAWHLLTYQYDWAIMPVIYLWDSEDQRRVDGIYGDDVNGTAKLRFPRMFSIRRLDEQQLYDTRFHWVGSRGGLHCGSIPQEGFQQIKPKAVVMKDLPIIHWGYLDEVMRQEKFTFYNTIDPGNTFEGGYLHIIGKPNAHAPGPVTLIPWKDV